MSDKVYLQQSVVVVEHTYNDDKSCLVEITSIYKVRLVHRHNISQIV